MKIAFYCQHLLGVGHLFRALEICKALNTHEVTLITGGPHVDVVFPEHIREFRLQALRMDSNFKKMFSAKSSAGLNRIKNHRQKSLFEYFKKEQPNLFILELYPFGRKAFRYEIDPVLQAIKEKELAVRGVFSSVRDILVEKEDQELHELRALRKLNTYFDGILFHSDPGLATLDETFYHFHDLRVPVVCTGFIAPKPPPGARQQLRHQLGMRDHDQLIVASAGGGTVGAPLLASVMRAYQHVNLEKPGRLCVFTGPHIEHREFKRLESMAGENVRIAKFTPDFLSYLSAAELSISMGGYNTIMNILSTGVPALVWPFPNNQEQRMRAERLEQKGLLKILDDDSMEPKQLASTIKQVLTTPRRPSVPIDLEGAANTAAWLNQWIEKNV